MPRSGQGHRSHHNDNGDAQDLNGDAHTPKVMMLGSYPVGHASQHQSSGHQTRSLPKSQQTFRPHHGNKLQNSTARDDLNPFLFRSVRLKQHLIRSTNQTLREVHRWMPDNTMKGNDVNEMDWQPEPELVIPQQSPVTYCWDSHRDDAAEDEKGAASNDGKKKEVKRAARDDDVEDYQRGSLKKLASPVLSASKVLQRAVNLR